MAPEDTVQPSSHLRVITNRISSTSSKNLPLVAQYLASSIANCRSILAASEKGSQNGDDSSILVHKLKTQITALLQDKSPHARYSAVILIKATVEAGSWSILQSTGAWVRGLISILARPDSLGTKKLCIITLTRIFLLTQEHQSLVREITTPALAGFITACLNIAKPSSSSKGPNALLPSVLQSLNELIALHPTSFRPYVSQLQAVVLPLIAPTPSDLSAADQLQSPSGSVVMSARRLFVLLHVCGPKGTAGEEWAKSLQNVIVSAERTADSVFRALVEDWRPSMQGTNVGQSTSFGEVVSDLQPGPLILPAWSGIYAGIERLDGLLRTVPVFLASVTSVSVVLPFSGIVSLVDRVLSALQPSSARSSRNRPEISREEREGLFAGLPQLHGSSLAILSFMLSRLDRGFAAVLHIALDHVFWILENEHHDEKVRQAAYAFVSQMLTAFGPSIPVSYATPLSRCIKLACADLLPSEEGLEHIGRASAVSGINIPNGTASGNADSYLKTADSRSTGSQVQADTLQIARELLRLSLETLPVGFLSYGIRCQIDRTAILLNDKEAMVASVMNPFTPAKGHKAASSIMPLLARAHQATPEVEALLRPQMPLLQAKPVDGGEAASDEEKDSYESVPRTNGASHGSHSDAFGLNSGRRVQPHPLEPRDGENLHTLSSGEVRPLDHASIPQSSLVASYVPTKRDREDDISFNAGTSDVIATTTTGVEPKDSEDANKRARLTETEQIGEGASVPQTDIPNQAAIVSAPAAPVAASPHDLHDIEGQEDSDESDFVMPTLYLDPDSDDTDEEENEEEAEIRRGSGNT